jgi:multiple sugar transport system permease protein
MADSTLVRTQALEQAVEPPAVVPEDRPDGRWWRRLPFYLGLAVATVAFCYPLVWLVSASLKPKSQVFDNRLIPEVFQPGNYVEVWKTAPVLNWLVNSLTVGLMAAAAVTLSSAAVAFGFAYFRFRLRGPLGFVDTQVPLWAQNLFGSAFYIFLLRQFFLGIPRELFEAARVDGCGYLGLFRRIALPLCRPALVIVFIFEFQASWSDLMRPLIYLQTPEYFTMPRGLKQLVDAFALSGEYRWEIAMAASVIATLPMIILFALGQRHILDGLATTAQKG